MAVTMTIKKIMMIMENKFIEINNLLFVIYYYKK